jgi:hypothetical protein
MTLKCAGCGGTAWKTRPSRRFAGITIYQCPTCKLALPSLWPPKRVSKEKQR